MNNFQTKVLWELFDEIVDGDPITTSIFQSVEMLHIGENYISDFTDLEQRFDAMDIDERPRDLYEMYELMGTKKTIIMHDEFQDVNFNKQFTWEREKPFDIIYNCGKSPHVFDQYNFFDNMHRLAGIGTYMIHCVPFFSAVESTLYSYSPNFFARLCGYNGYSMHKAFIGTTTGERFEKLIIEGEYAGNAYAERHKFFQWANGEDKGYKRPAHIAVILKKTENTEFKSPEYRNVQEDD